MKHCNRCTYQGDGGGGIWGDRCLVCGGDLIDDESQNKVANDQKVAIVQTTLEV